MDKQALIDMLNKDLADEHISVIRYLIHAYQVGEDTPLGSILLSMAREEMWHTDWLGDLIGELGARLHQPGEARRREALQVRSETTRRASSEDPGEEPLSETTTIREACRSPHGRLFSPDQHPTPPRL